MWKLEDFVGAVLRQGSFAASGMQIIPFLVRELVLAEEGSRYSLQAEYERVSSTLAGMSASAQYSMLELPAEAGESHAATRVVDSGDS